MFDNVFIMTVDVDSWSSLLNFYSVKHEGHITEEQVAVEEGVENLLNTFNYHEIKATFFVPGEVCFKHTKILGKIRKYDHEIASHGLIHDKTEFLLDQSEQERRIREATKIIQEVSGLRPMGFRAPCLRADESTLRTLENFGYIYDSSVVPTLVPGYYGHLDAPLKPYYPSFQSINKRGSCRVLEIPVSVNPIFRLPLSAAWMRNLGYSWVKIGINMNFELGNPIVFYVHPRDVVVLPRIRGMPWHVYRNTGKNAVEMLDKIIRHAKRLRAKFMKAVDFAQMWMLEKGIHIEPPCRIP